MTPIGDEPACADGEIRPHGICVERKQLLNEEHLCSQSEGRGCTGYGFLRALEAVGAVEMEPVSNLVAEAWPDKQAYTCQAR